MKRMWIIGMTLCFVMSFAWTQARSADGAAAMIVKVTGAVKVQRGAKQKTIDGKFTLAWGDKVLVPSGSTALILFANGKKVTAKADMDITEETAKIDSAKAGGAGAGTLVKAMSGGSGGNSDLKAKGGTGGAVRAAGGKAAVQITSYLNTNTINVRPNFTWTPTSDAKKSTLVLMDEDGKELWKFETTDNVAAYPKELPELTPGKEYTVEITSLIDDEDVSSSSTFFVVDEDQSKEIGEAVKSIKDEYGVDDDVIIQDMLLAQYYKEKELYMDSINELKKLVALDPNDLNSHKMLSEIYYKIGNKVEGAKEDKKIEELQKELAEQEKF